MTFGQYIRDIRQNRNITLRSVAERLGIAPAYLCDVEYNRRNPFDLDKLTRLSDILVLSKKERNTMYDLAGKTRNEAPPDITDYVIKRDYVSHALRMAKDLGAGEKEWQWFVNNLKRKG